VPPRVELYVEECLDNLSSAAAINVRQPHSHISAQMWESWFDSWVEILEPWLPIALSYEIGLRLTDDAQIQILNTQYRQKNEPTDVLAFAALEVECPQTSEMLADAPLYLGDIIVSVDTAHLQSQQQGHSLSTELAWLVAHGLLHLLGWDHPDESSLSQMLKQQVVLLNSIGIAINLEY